MRMKKLLAAALLAVSVVAGASEAEIAPPGGAQPGEANSKRTGAEPGEAKPGSPRTEAGAKAAPTRDEKRGPSRAKAGPAHVTQPKQDKAKPCEEIRPCPID
jgi:hypothetical protein